MFIVVFPFLFVLLFLDGFFSITTSRMLKSVLFIKFYIFLTLFEKLYSFCKVILTSDSITLYTRLQELLFHFCSFFLFFQKIGKKSERRKDWKGKIRYNEDWNLRNSKA